MLEYKKEEYISKLAIILLKWDNHNEKLYSRGFPIKLKGKQLLSFSRKSSSIKKKTKEVYELFTPSKKREHLQFLIDFISKDDKIDYISTYMRKDKYFSDIIVNNEIIFSTVYGYDIPEESICITILKYYKYLDEEKYYENFY